MKHAHSTPAVTSLPQSPQVESDSRVRRYMVTMVIRTTCFVLMALVQPYGWWTWAFAAGAIFLPYIAVVDANAGSDSTTTKVESPLQQIEAPAAAPVEPEAPTVITIHERRVDAAAGDTAGDAAEQDGPSADGR